jgi:hypothetical protein
VTRKRSKTKAGFAPANTSLVIGPACVCSKPPCNGVCWYWKVATLGAEWWVKR